MTEQRQPWMQFWGDDFFGSERVLALRPQHQILYLRLLWMAHREGSIPADTRLLARMCGLSHRAFLAGWGDGIAGAFTPHPENQGRLVNGKLERIKGAQQGRQGTQPEDRDTAAARRSEKARRAARARWSNAQEDAPSNAPEHPAEQCPEHPPSNAPSNAPGIAQAMPSESESEPDSESSQHSGGTSTPQERAKDGPGSDPEPDHGPGGDDPAEAHRKRLAVLERAGFATPQERQKVALAFTEVHPRTLAALWESGQGRKDIKRPSAWFARIVRKGPGEVLSAAKHLGHKPTAEVSGVAADAVARVTSGPANQAVEEKPTGILAELVEAIEATGATVSKRQSHQMAQELLSVGCGLEDVRSTWEAAQGQPDRGRAAWWRAEMRHRVRRQVESADPALAGIYGEAVAHG